MPVLIISRFLVVAVGLFSACQKDAPSVQSPIDKTSLRERLADLKQSKVGEEPKVITDLKNEIAQAEQQGKDTEEMQKKLSAVETLQAKREEEVNNLEKELQTAVNEDDTQQKAKVEAKIAALEEAEVAQQNPAKIVDDTEENDQGTENSPALTEEVTSQLPRLYLYARHAGKDYSQHGVGYVIGFSDIEGVTEVKISVSGYTDSAIFPSRYVDNQRGASPISHYPETIISFVFMGKKYCAEPEKFRFVPYLKRSSKEHIIASREEITNIRVCNETATD